MTTNDHTPDENESTPPKLPPLLAKIMVEAIERIAKTLIDTPRPQGHSPSHIPLSAMKGKLVESRVSPDIRILSGAVAEASAMRGLALASMYATSAALARGISATIATAEDPTTVPVVSMHKELLRRENSESLFLPNPKAVPLPVDLDDEGIDMYAVKRNADLLDTLFSACGQALRIVCNDEGNSKQALAATLSRVAEASPAERLTLVSLLTSHQTALSVLLQGMTALRDPTAGPLPACFAGLEVNTTIPGTDAVAGDALRDPFAMMTLGQRVVSRVVALNTRLMTEEPLAVVEAMAEGIPVALREDQNTMYRVGSSLSRAAHRGLGEGCAGNVDTVVELVCLLSNILTTPASTVQVRVDGDDTTITIKGWVPELHAAESPLVAAFGVTPLPTAPTTPDTTTPDTETTA